MTHDETYPLPPRTVPRTRTCRKCGGSTYMRWREMRDHEATCDGTLPEGFWRKGLGF